MCFGSSRLRTSAMTKITATGFCAKMDWMTGGKFTQIPASVDAVKPIPMAREREAISLFLVVNPASDIICFKLLG